MIQTNPKPTPRDQPTLDASYDVVVLGGGPAGSTVAAFTAQAGINTVVLERTPFPRFHVGESLIPECYWTLEKLGVLDRLRASAFPKKFSVQFVTEKGRVTSPFYFHDHNPHESSQTWQVVRGDFDQMLIENAEEKGATIRTDAQVLDVVFENDRAVGVNVKLKNGSSVTVAANVVVDATGQSSFLMNRLGLRRKDPRLKKGAIWTYYRGSQRDEGRDEGATIILQTEGKKSWFWNIPLPDDVVSVGCTGNLNYLFGKKNVSSADIFQRELDRCPVLKSRLSGATGYDEYFTTKDFSYFTSKAAGEGWVLVGDAFGFIDPVYSSGVFLALKSGEMAASGIVDACKTHDFSAEVLGNWQNEYRKGVEMFRKLVYAFYTPGFSFGKFLKEHSEMSSRLVDILVGDVFKPGVEELFEKMGEVLPPLDDSAVVASDVDV